MLRSVFKNKDNGVNFRFRGKESGRLENFSDAVFALAITLLLISTSPPNNFLQLKRFVFDLIPFIFCIVLIILIWHEHFVFYYRYGLRNGKVILLNTLFLIIVLFFVYPLKFLTKLSLFLVAIVFEIDWLKADLYAMVKDGYMGDLMMIYGAGAASVFFVLMLMYRYALKMKDQMDLNEMEIFDTKVSIRTNLLMAIVPLVSMVIVILFYGHWIAGLLGGLTYTLYPPLMALHRRNVNKQRKLIYANLEKTSKELVEIDSRSKDAPMDKFDGD